MKGLGTLNPKPLGTVRPGLGMLRFPLQQSPWTAHCGAKNQTSTEQLCTQVSAAILPNTKEINMFIANTSTNFLSNRGGSSSTDMVEATHPENILYDIVHTVENRDINNQLE